MSQNEVSLENWEKKLYEISRPSKEYEGKVCVFDMEELKSFIQQLLSEKEKEVKEAETKLGKKELEMWENSRDLRTDIEQLTNIIDYLTINTDEYEKQRPFIRKIREKYKIIPTGNA